MATKEAKSNSPKFDISLIKFPSDELTLGNLRNLYPHAYGYLSCSPEKWVKEVDKLLNHEGELAVITFEKCIGGGTNYQILKDSGENMKDLIKGVVDLYVKFGLATGSHQGRELAKKVVTQVEKIATELIGNKRP